MVFDRLSGTNSLLATGTAGAGWTTWLARPALSLDASECAFASWDAGLVSGNWNRTAGDLFAGDLSGWPALDSDADGIPDWWMIEYFGHPTGQAGDRSRAQDDADGDRMNNLQEFIAGLNPTDPNSVLALSMATDASGTNRVVSWGEVAGKNYQLLSVSNLNNLVWQAVPGNAQAVPGSVWANGSRQYFTIPTTNPQSYFRVQVGN